MRGEALPCRLYKPTPNTRQLKFKEIPSLIAKGFCMGTADLVPGVSGGTMAFILGIYERLLNAIKSFDGAWLLGTLRLDMRVALGHPHFSFLIPLLTGIGLALVFFTKVISLPQLIVTQPELIYGLFFGLILASIAVLMQEIDRFGIKELCTVTAGTVLGLVVVNLVPFETPEAPWFVFLCGCVAICAMVLPGISGSFVLLILHKYEYVLGSLGQVMAGRVSSACGKARR